MFMGEKAANRPAARLLRLVALVPAEEKEATINLLRRIQIVHPDDFWTTDSLGLVIHRLYQWDEALRYLTAAVALRPRSAGAQFQLGIALRDKGRWDDADKCTSKHKYDGSSRRLGDVDRTQRRE
jgi:eukaryotic-like serine/threonine-protein kinase